MVPAIITQPVNRKTMEEAKALELKPCEIYEYDINAVDVVKRDAHYISQVLYIERKPAWEKGETKTPEYTRIVIAPGLSINTLLTPAQVTERIAKYRAILSADNER